MATVETVLEATVEMNLDQTEAELRYFRHLWLVRDAAAVFTASWSRISTFTSYNMEHYNAFICVKSCAKLYKSKSF